MATFENNHSRIHPLRTFPSGFYIKRDDELSFGASGSKWRKMLSLIPALCERKAISALLIGSAHSNNVLALSQRLAEKGIRPIGLLLEPHSPSDSEGVNFFLSSLFLSEIHWVRRADWPRVREIAESLAPPGCIIIPEGANMPESYEGALTLAEDIKRNEEEIGQSFQHIFLDAGTGFMAKACIERLARASTQFHVVMMAPCQENLPNSSNVHLYRPRIGSSFGSTPSGLFPFIAEFARCEGVLLDPIYSAKLFYEAQHISREKKIEGPALIVHSGGALSLLGFQKRFKAR